MMKKMHEDYAANIQSRQAAVNTSCVLSLKQLCMTAASQHVKHVDMKALLELPTSLIKDLLPHLNIIDLERLQPALNGRGISTYSAWVAILQDIWGRRHAMDFHTEEECKTEAMDKLFRLVFYGFSNGGVIKHLPKVNINSLLLVIAKYLTRFHVKPSRYLPSLATEQKVLLNSLERTVQCVEVKQHLLPSRGQCDCILYILHRLLDHGQATQLVIHNQDAVVVSWMLQDRASSCHRTLVHGRTGIFAPAAGECGPRLQEPDNEEAHVVPRKRPKFEPEEEDCGTPGEHPKDLLQPPLCPRGHIASLQLRECGQDVISILTPLLPTWLSLQSLSLHTHSVCRGAVLGTLLRSLEQLCAASGSRLTELSMLGVLPHPSCMTTLLDACPTLTALWVELHPMPENPALQPTRDVKKNRKSTHAHRDSKSECGPRFQEPDNEEAHVVPTTSAVSDTELSLSHLSVKVAQVEIDVRHVTRVLKRCPQLTSLHLSGLRMPSGFSNTLLLRCISESRGHLKKLHLEDVNMAKYLPDVVHVLTTCSLLQELSLRDCRLLERCSDKEHALRQLVDCVKRASSLRSLSLAQNRLAKNVSTLTELYAGPSQSTVTTLDISSNFIQPADLLEFAQRLQQNPPAQRVTLDLRRNPWDRDQHAWNSALRCLRTVCDFILDDWRSTDTMADHISMM